MLKFKRKFRRQKVKNERNTHSKISVWVTFQTEEDMWVNQKEDGETNTHEDGTSKKMAF